MMEGTRCEKIETSNEIGSEIKTEPITEMNSIFYEKDGKLVELDSKLREDVCAVLKGIKYEETEVPEQIEPGTLSQTCEIPRSEQSLEFSGIISEFTDCTALLTSLCRLCATRSNSMIHMFNQNELQDDVIEKIEYCLPIKVKKSDTLPKEICHLCLEKLEMCYQFHKTVEAAEKQFLTLDDRQCNEEKYTYFSDPDARSSIIKPQSILQELLKTDTKTLGNSTILSNSMLRNEKYCTNRPNEERGMESSSDKDSQSIRNSLLTSSLHDMDEKPRFEINPSLEEEAETYASNNDNVIRKEVFNKRTSAEQRIIGHELIKCQNCRETFETAVNQCFAHSSIRASKGYFPCCLCGAIFQTKGDCNQHRLEHEQGENMKRGGLRTDNKSIKKPLREVKLKAKMELNSNISSKNELHCKKCNEDIDSETSLHQRYQHMLNVHKQQKKLSHNICEKKLSASEQLIVLQSKRDFSFECKLCNRRFRSHYDLEVHEKTDCSRPLISTKKEFTCIYCRQRFRLKGDLKIHLRIHTGERPYDCDMCGKMFRIKDIKDSNLKIHTSERPFKCSKCNKRFSTSSILTLHSLVHSDARPYSCHLCHLSFKTLRGRDLHLTIHTGERPFKCSKCEKRFPTSSALTRHSLVHSDDKPYSCHLCHLSFKRIYGRDLHLRKHTGVKPYKCDICGVSHTKMSLYLRHRRLKPCLKALAARSQN